MPNLYGPLSPAPMESNGVFPFLLNTEQVGDILQLILSQAWCTLCLHWDCKVSAQNKRTWMENCSGSCFGSSTVYKLARSCLRDRCSSLKKEILCCQLFQMDNWGGCAKIVNESSIWIFLPVSSLVMSLSWSKDVHIEDICSVVFVRLEAFLLLIESLWSVFLMPVEMPREPWLEHWKTSLCIYVSQLIDHKQTSALS